VGAYVYILKCTGGAFYVGSTRGSLETRVGEHNAGRYGGFTATQRPVSLAYSEYFDRITDAIAAERKLKGWSRAKKIALMSGDFNKLSLLSRNRTQFPTGE
jgi:putative endonuclease